MRCDFAIDVKELNKSFGDKHVVKDLTLKVPRGQIFGFLGPNGSGKTTSIRMICGLLTADSGSGTCLGYDVMKQSAEIKREVGYMTQRFSLWEDLTIRENMDFVARMYGMADRKRGGRRMRSRIWASPARQDQLAGALSGGWKQRLALASCLLHQPKLLLLDEPTAGVDPKARRDFWDELHRCARWASRCWSPRTTWTRPSAATSSPTSPTASCSRSAPRPNCWRSTARRTWRRCSSS